MASTKICIRVFDLHEFYYNDYVVPGILINAEDLIEQFYLNRGYDVVRLSCVQCGGISKVTPSKPFKNNNFNLFMCGFSEILKNNHCRFCDLICKGVPDMLIIKRNLVDEIIDFNFIEVKRNTDSLSMYQLNWLLKYNLPASIVCVKKTV